MCACSQRRQDGQLRGRTWVLTTNRFSAANVEAFIHSLLENSPYLLTGLLSKPKTTPGIDYISIKASILASSFNVLLRELGNRYVDRLGHAMNW